MHGCSMIMFIYRKELRKLFESLDEMVKAWYIDNTYTRYISEGKNPSSLQVFCVEIFKSLFRIGESLNLLYLHFYTLWFSPFT